MAVHIVNTNQECPKCRELLKKGVDTSRFVMVYICPGCKRQFKAEPGKDNPVGEEIKRESEQD